MKNENNLLGGVAFMFILLILLMLLGACTTQKKAVKYFNNHGFEAAQYCAGAFPVISDTVFKPGKPIHKTDTTYLPGDSVPCPPGGKDTLFIPCPPSPVIHDSVLVHDTLEIEKKDSAELAVLYGKIKRKTQDSIKVSVSLQTYKEKARRRGKLMWGTWIVLLLAGGAWLYFKGKLGIIKNIINKIR